MHPDGIRVTANPVRITEAWPLADGWEERLLVYQPYHDLSHLNLLVSSYLGGCLDLLRRFA